MKISLWRRRRIMSCGAERRGSLTYGIIGSLDHWGFMLPHRIASYYPWSSIPAANLAGVLELEGHKLVDRGQSSSWSVMIGLPAGSNQRVGCRWMQTSKEQWRFWWVAIGSMLLLSLAATATNRIDSQTSRPFQARHLREAARGACPACFSPRVSSADLARSKGK